MRRPRLAGKRRAQAPCGPGAPASRDFADMQTNSRPDEKSLKGFARISRLSDQRRFLPEECRTCSFQFHL
jgi:hypothetical protein